MPSPQKKTDPLLQIKYYGYCLANLDFGKVSFEDYTQYAKFQLCRISKRLLKDPIWDSYTAEEILLEFFAHEFTTNKEFLKSFEELLRTTGKKVEDFSDWADREIEKEKMSIQKTLEELPESISFNPNTDVMGSEQ